MNYKDFLRKNASYAAGAVLGYGATYIYDRWKAKQIIVISAETDESVREEIEERQKGFIVDAEAYNNLPVIDPQLQALLDEEDEIERRKEAEMQAQVTEAYTVNVFAQPDGDWNYEDELSTREKLTPYVLHRDEFMGDEMDFRQETMTYYAGDDVMVDPLDNPIYNYSELMGDLKFGHGSGAANVVYVRNEGIRMEWEILRHEGTYAYEVMGLQAEQQVENELRHSGPLKFRRD